MFEKNLSKNKHYLDVFIIIMWAIQVIRQHIFSPFKPYFPLSVNDKPPLITSAQVKYFKKLIQSLLMSAMSYPFFESAFETLLYFRCLRNICTVLYHIFFFFFCYVTIFLMDVSERSNT